MPLFKSILAMLLFDIWFLVSASTIHATTYPCTTNCPELSPGTSSGDWPMAGGNLQRTSWNSEEVRGRLYVEWYRPIEPYIAYKIQPIAAHGKIFVTTAKGLLAFNADNGNLDWTYSTQMPLGHSPTYANGVLYVGGHDKQLHALNADTGLPISGYTPYQAGAGFETNPLVVNNTVYAGNRDGYFYALNATTGSLLWRFHADAPVLFSAAFKNNTLYFADNDGYAYSLNATSGTQIWKSRKFTGQGFQSYWPVIYTDKVTGTDYVVFSGSENYRNSEFSPVHTEWSTLFPDCIDGICPSGELIGPTSIVPSNDTFWLPGTLLIDATKILDYHRQYPHRRTVFILTTSNGQEYSFDANQDGIREYAPFTSSGVTHSGTRYPALVNAIDGIFYHNTQYVSSGGYIPRGDPVGWKFGSNQVSRAFTAGGHAVDEPMAFTSGGRLAYWTLCCDREAGTIDLTAPYDHPGRSTGYVTYNFLTKAPNYRQMYYDGEAAAYADENGWQVYSGRHQSINGIYGKHSTTQAPSVAYRDRVYMLKGNALLAWTPTIINTAQQLSLVENPNTPLPTTPHTIDLRQKLSQEIQKMIAVGLLKPGYHASGIQDDLGRRSFENNGVGEIYDYFQNPADTVVTLIQALPHLSAQDSQDVRTYLQTHYGPGSTYDFTRIAHVGWGTGSSRDNFDIPPEAMAIFGQYARPPLNPSTTPVCGTCGYWRQFPPYSFYAALKYAQVFGNATQIFDLLKNKVEAPPTDPTTGQITPAMVQRPYLLHLYIAGYQGYLELEKLAGYQPENTTVRGWLNLVTQTRINNFSKDTPFWPNSVWGGGGTRANYLKTLSVARNFMFLTPEIAQELKSQKLSDVQAAMAEYEYLAPYWFVTKFDQTNGEGTLHPLYDYPALFQAKAWVLGETQEELVKYLDVPAFERGDLFYIQNLVAAIEAPSSSGFNPDLNNDAVVDYSDYSLFLPSFNSLFSIFDLNRLVSRFGSLL